LNGGFVGQRIKERERRRREGGGGREREEGNTISIVMI
jgi:hypothetical protein